MKHTLEPINVSEFQKRSEEWLHTLEFEESMDWDNLDILRYLSWKRRVQLLAEINHMFYLLDFLGREIDAGNSTILDLANRLEEETAKACTAFDLDGIKDCLLAVKRSLKTRRRD